MNILNIKPILNLELLKELKFQFKNWSIDWSIDYNNTGVYWHNVYVFRLLYTNPTNNFKAAVFCYMTKNNNDFLFEWRLLKNYLNNECEELAPNFEKWIRKIMKMQAFI